ncbi:hypothetical protein LCGC14_1551640 [marine sediment metagenome]|uniref:Uncharacterized protein n=1 Tax=marine sediment metagenome TaxID=412755 RepID=A0A0F9LQX0_9ZZZZ
MDVCGRYSHVLRDLQNGNMERPPSIFLRIPVINKQEIILRRSDGKLFFPSFPPGWTDYDAYCSMFAGGGYYFIGIKRIPPRWYWPFTTYQKTGEIWETKDHRAFDMAYRPVSE